MAGASFISETKSNPTTEADRRCLNVPESKQQLQPIPLHNVQGRVGPFTIVRQDFREQRETTVQVFLDSLRNSHSSDCHFIEINYRLSVFSILNILHRPNSFNSINSLYSRFRIISFLIILLYCPNSHSLP